VSHTIYARNVNEGYVAGRHLLKQWGLLRGSRAGPVIEVPWPVLTVYTDPCERVLFDAERDANPFFHLFEAIWMMAGRDDLAWLVQFNGRMREFSDNDYTLRGAYGARWRRHWPTDMESCNITDQLQVIRAMLKSDLDTRRAVLTMWDPDADLDSTGKDLPCNTHVYFYQRSGYLETTVCNRSNDILWGLYGANAVHMSVLHEWMAAAVGLLPGRLNTLSNSFHAYNEVLSKLGPVPMVVDNRYETTGGVTALPLVANADDWLQEAELFCNEGLRATYREPFFLYTAGPMLRAWKARKTGDLETMNLALAAIAAPDWRTACREWVRRRRPLP
jgi:Thymidylate synthase